MVSFSGAFLNSHSLAWKFVPKTFFYNNMEFWNSHLPSINSLHCHHCRLFVVDREWDLIGHWLSRNGSLIGAGIQGRGKYEHEQTTFTTFCSKKNVDWFPLKCHHTISCGCLDKEEKKWYFYLNLYLSWKTAYIFFIIIYSVPCFEGWDQLHA